MAICNITGNEYICRQTNDGINTYVLNSDNEFIENDMDILNKNLYIDITKNEISLKAYSSNHYLLADEKAHCSEQWQDWFCISNYHNNNSYYKYPNTQTMSVGKCYNPCDAGYIIGKTYKCYKYTSDNDLIYNPLAIIAMLGANIEPYSIGIRGSYLNDLYRVNNNNKFIQNRYVKLLLSRNNKASYTSPIYDGQTNITNQETFLLQILENFIKKSSNISSINQIKGDIKITIDTFIKINKIKEFNNNLQDKNIFLNKIKNYSFDIDRLESLYGKDKNGKFKFENIIAYVYNIMYPIFYNNKNAVYLSQEVEGNIQKIINNIPITYAPDETPNTKEEIKNNLRLIFKYACYNCFSYNFQLFEKYLKKTWADIDNVIMEITSEGVEKKCNTIYFKICNTIDLQETIILKESKSTIPYNNIGFYDHYLLSEYSDNTRYIIQLLIIFAIIFCLILFICLVYSFLMIKMFGLKYKLIHYITHFINYVHLFYKWLTFNLLIFISQGYWFICELCKYRWNIFSVVMNIINICILIYLVNYLFTSIIDLLNIDYITLLANIKYDGKGGDTTMSIVNYHTINSTIFYYLLCIYLISIYLYSAYLMRYSKSSSEFDIISNYDADNTITKNYLNNLLLSEYASNMLSNFDSSYTIEELTKGSKAVINYHYDDPESGKEPDIKPEKTNWIKSINEFGKNVYGFLISKKDDNTDGNIDDNNTTPEPQVQVGSDTPNIPNLPVLIQNNEAKTTPIAPIIATPIVPSTIIAVPSPHIQYGFPSHGPPQQYQQPPGPQRFLTGPPGPQGPYGQQGLYGHPGQQVPNSLPVFNNGYLSPPVSPGPQRFPTGPQGPYGQQVPFGPPGFNNGPFSPPRYYNPQFQLQR